MSFPSLFKKNFRSSSVFINLFQLVYSMNVFASSTSIEPGQHKVQKDETFSEKSEWEVTGLPAFIRSPETGLGLGGVVVVVPPTDGQKENPITTGMMYTEKQQFLFGAGSRQYFNNDETSVSFGLRLEDYPDFEFGVGNQADRHSGKLYKKDLFCFYIDYLQTVKPDLYLGLALDYHYREFSKFEEGGRLYNNELHGQEGGPLMGAFGVMRYHNGDDPFLPMDGNFILATYGRYFSTDRSNEFNKFNLDLRFYRPSHLFEKGASAFQVILFDLSENPPWDQLPTLGGSQLLRGYHFGRYRERKLLATQYELRQQIAEKWWLVWFYGAGQVARDWDDMNDSEIHHGTGFGGRYQVGERTRMNLRVDLAWAVDADSPSLYVYIMEAF